MASRTEAAAVIRFIEQLKIPEGPNAGQDMKLTPYQKKFIRGAFAKENNIAVLSIGRGNAKTALSSAIALACLFGVWDHQPRREVVVAARSKEQGRIAFDFIVGFLQTLPGEMQQRVQVRRNPRLEIEYDGEVEGK